MLFINNSDKFYHDNMYLMFVYFVLFVGKSVIDSIHLLRELDFRLIYGKSYLLKNGFCFHKLCM